MDSTMQADECLCISHCSCSVWVQAILSSSPVLHGQISLPCLSGVPCACISVSREFTYLRDAGCLELEVFENTLGCQLELFHLKAPSWPRPKLHKP